MRIDPALGALAPALAAPSYMATQVEILRSERVASRVVKMLGVERSASAVAAMARCDQREDPARALLRQPAAARPRRSSLRRGSNVMNISLLGAGPDLRAGRGQRLRAGLHGRLGRAAHRAGPPVGAFLDDQTKALRTNLEQAQARLSKFQQDKGIVVSDERLDQENARYNALVSQLATAQAEQVDASTRQRNTGTRNVAGRPATAARSRA